MATKTYYCGKNAFIHKYDHTLDAWTNVSLPSPNNTKFLYDIMCFPGNPDKVVVVGEGSNIGKFTVWLSNDAGLTWTQIGPLIPGQVNNAVIYEVWISEGSIFIAGENFGLPMVFKSDNDGSTWTNISAGLPQAAVLSIHFPTPSFGVVGVGTYIYRTQDGGTTWLATNGGSPITIIDVTNTAKGIREIPGIHIYQDPTTLNFRITAMTRMGVVQSVDNGVSYLTRLCYPDTLGIGEHLTWQGNNVFWGTDNTGGMIYSYNAGASWDVVLPYTTLPLASNNMPAAQFYEVDDSYAGPGTRYNGFVGVNVNSPSSSTLYQVNSTTTFTIATTPQNLVAGTAAEANTPGILLRAVWTEVEIYKCVRLKECNGTQEVIIRDVYQSGSALTLSSLGLGANVTLTWNANTASPCALITDQFPAKCWVIEEIIENCDIADTCEEVVIIT